ncbi:MAG: CHRD domain-containing protein [Steroidobacteraceae bacterium]
MNIAISRRTILLLVCLSGLALSSTPSLAASQSFEVTLSGAQQVPPVDTAGKGTAKLTYDPATRVVHWTITYEGLSGAVTMAHFHGPAEPGKNAGVQVWLAKQGSAVQSPIRGHATLTPDQAKQFEAGEWYVNLHTKAHPGGEIRGQVVPPKG